MVEHILWIPELLGSEQSVIVLPPVPPHPVTAVTARPVDVLAVGKLGSVEVALHPLLDPDDLPGTLAPPVSEQADQVGVHPVLEVVPGVGGDGGVGVW